MLRQTKNQMLLEMEINYKRVVSNSNSNGKELQKIVIEETG